MNNRSGIELTFLLSSGESLFIKIDSLKDSLNALFSQHKIEKLLKLLLLCSFNNKWSYIADGLHEQNNTFCFFDINITRQNNQLKTSVNRKPTFGGDFTHYESSVD